MAVYYGRLEDISIKLLKTAKTTTETYGLGTGDLAGENIVDF